jgi:hypothetical protein
MAQDVLVRASGFFKGVRQDRQPAVVEGACWQVPLVVGGLGQADHGGVMPGQDGGVEGDGAEGAADDLQDELTLVLHFDLKRRAGV